MLNRKHTCLLIVSACLLLPVMGKCQLIDIKNHLKEAEKDYAAGKYQEAMTIYKNMYFSNDNSVPLTKGTLLFRMADCYRGMNDYKNEIYFYKKAIQTGYKDSAQAYKYISSAQKKMNGKEVKPAGVVKDSAKKE